MNGLNISVITINETALTNSIFKQLPELEIDGLGVVLIGGLKCGFISRWKSGLTRETRDGKLVNLDDASCDLFNCFSLDNDECKEKSLACPLWSDDKPVLIVMGYVLVKNRAVFLVIDNEHGLSKISESHLATIVASETIHFSVVDAVDPDDVYAGVSVHECTSSGKVRNYSNQIFLA